MTKAALYFSRKSYTTFGVALFLQLDFDFFTHIWYNFRYNSTKGY